MGNTVGDSVGVLEAGGEVIFTANEVEGSAVVDKTTGSVTADGNSIGFQPPEPPPEPGEPPPEPGQPEVASGGSLFVSEASEGAIVRDNTVTGYLEVTENLIATTVSNNTVLVGITVAKNVGVTEVSFNRAGGDIECKDNNPPAVGGGNVAGADGGSGSLKGECAPPV
jgi:hypothetical protein